jgi:hypothetical protein
MPNWTIARALSGIVIVLERADHIDRVAERYPIGL